MFYIFSWQFFILVTFNWPNQFIKQAPFSFLSKIVSNARYHTGYPKDLGLSRVIDFTSEREFVHLLHEGYPVVVAFTIRSFIVGPALLFPLYDGV